MSRPGRRNGAAMLALVTVLLAFTATACGGVSRAHAPGPPRAPTKPVPAALTTTHTDVGTVMADGSGRTLYVFTADIRGDRSACESECLHTWPMLDAPAAHAGHGVSAMKIATLTRVDGTVQITYHEWPLYYFSGDDSVGDIDGQGVHEFGGTWWVLSPDGHPIKKEP